MLTDGKMVYEEYISGDMRVDGNLTINGTFTNILGTAVYTNFTVNSGTASNIILPTVLNITQSGVVGGQVAEIGVYNGNAATGAWKFGQTAAGSADWRLDSTAVNLSGAVNVIDVSVVTGQIIFPINITSTSTTTGSLLVGGGLGVAGDLFAGTVHAVGITSTAGVAVGGALTGVTSIAGSLTTMSLQQITATGLGGASGVAGVFSSNVASTTVGTGTVKIGTGTGTGQGGLGVAGSINAGGNAAVAGNITCNLITAGGVVGTGAGAGFFPNNTANTGYNQATGNVVIGSGSGDAQGGLGVAGNVSAYKFYSASSYEGVAANVVNLTASGAIVGGTATISGATNVGTLTSTGAVQTGGNLTVTGGNIIGTGAPTVIYANGTATNGENFLLRVGDPGAYADLGGFGQTTYGGGNHAFASFQNYHGDQGGSQKPVSSGFIGEMYGTAWNGGNNTNARIFAVHSTTLASVDSTTTMCQQIITPGYYIVSFTCAVVGGTYNVEANTFTAWLGCDGATSILPGNTVVSSQSENLGTTSTTLSTSLPLVLVGVSNATINLFCTFSHASGAPNSQDNYLSVVRIA